MFKVRIVQALRHYQVWQYKHIDDILIVLAAFVFSLFIYMVLVMGFCL